MIVACDVGYGHVKQAVAEIRDNEAFVTHIESFPSIIRRVEPGVYGIAEHPDYVERNGKAFLIGRSADWAEETRIRDPHIFLERLPLFLERARKFWTGIPSILVLGTPFQEWKRIAEEIKEAASEFAERVECYPQAAAAAVRFKLGKPFLVLDIGFNTVDVVPVDTEGRVLADRGVSWDRTGASRLLSRLRDRIRSVFGLGISPLILERILVKPKSAGYHLPTGKSDEFADYVRELISEYTFELVTRLVDRYGNTFRVIVPVGGGARVCGRYLKSTARTFGFKVVSVSEPELANVKGFLSLGLASCGFTGKLIFPEKERKRDNSKQREKKNEKKEEENENSE